MSERASRPVPMQVSATRVALVVFLIGALGVWLIRPIGDACPDLGKLPAGSRSSSAPSFTPPLTRTCTYATAGGIEARQRYVPIVDWIVLAVAGRRRGAGGRAAGGSGRAARAAGRKAEVDGPPDWLAEPEPPPPPPARGRRRAPSPPRVPLLAPPAPSPDGESEAAARAAQRELERQERARRRGR